MGLINQALKNYLNDVCEQPRYACYIREGKLRVYIQGGEYIEYDPKEDEINLLDRYSVGLKINPLSINISLLRKIYQKLITPGEKENEVKQLKERYGITSKRFGEKERADIAKYEAAWKKGIGSA